MTEENPNDKAHRQLNLILQMELHRKMKDNAALVVTTSVYAAIALLGWVLLVCTLLFSGSAEAAQGRNWCADWADGYQNAYYLTCRSCNIIEPMQCPEPESDQLDGYMRGVVDGSADGKQKQRELSE